MPSPRSCEVTRSSATIVVPCSVNRKHRTEPNVLKRSTNCKVTESIQESPAHGTYYFWEDCKLSHKDGRIACTVGSYIAKWLSYWLRKQYRGYILEKKLAHCFSLCNLLSLKHAQFDHCQLYKNTKKILYLDLVCATLTFHILWKEYMWKSFVVVVVLEGWGFVH